MVDLVFLTVLALGKKSENEVSAPFGSRRMAGAWIKSGETRRTGECSTTLTLSFPNQPKSVLILAMKAPETPSGRKPPIPAVRKVCR